MSKVISYKKHNVDEATNLMYDLIEKYVVMYDINLLCNFDKNEVLIFNKKIYEYFEKNDMLYLYNKSLLFMIANAIYQYRTKKEGVFDIECLISNIDGLNFSLDKDKKISDFKIMLLKFGIYKDVNLYRVNYFKTKTKTKEVNKFNNR